MLGTELKMSTAFHPQTDGQTERTNALLEMYLRHYVSANQRDWVRLLDQAQFSYNLQRSESTGKSPFEVITGLQPDTPGSIAADYMGRSPTAYRFVRDLKEDTDLVQVSLWKATKRMKKWADIKRRAAEFQVGDRVLVKLYHHMKLKSGYHKALVRRYEGPFIITHRIGETAYRLSLPSKLKVHPVFHVSLLKPFKEDTTDPSRARSGRAPVAVRVHYTKKVSEIKADRKKGNRVQYLVRWKGLSDSEASWEYGDELWQFEDIINEYRLASSGATSA